MQDDWPEWLSLAEFIGNNTNFETTTVILFFANKRFYLGIGFEPAKPPPINTREVDANFFAISIEEIQEILCDNMLFAQADLDCHWN